MRLSARRLVLFVLCTGFLPAQTSVHAEEALKRFFEGKQVRPLYRTGSGRRAFGIFTRTVYSGSTISVTGALAF